MHPAGASRALEELSLEQRDAAAQDPGMALQMEAICLTRLEYDVRMRADDRAGLLATNAASAFSEDSMFSRLIGLAAIGCFVLVSACADSGSTGETRGDASVGAGDAGRDDAGAVDAGELKDAGEFAGCTVGAPRCDSLPGARSCVAGSSWVTCGAETTCRINYLAAGTRCGPGAVCNSQHECVAGE